MTRQPARMLEPADVRLLQEHVGSLRHGTRNRVIVEASFKAGLRACEIAGLTWPMALTSDGKISDQLTISASIAKYGSGRLIPMHTDLKRALRSHHKQSGRPDTGPIVMSERGGPMTAQSIVNWFAAAYADIGIVGASSHSGRRTFITRSARAISKAGGSLRDVQELAGHRALTTTER
ncbi:MAG: site-specific integrase [Pseudomonadota bacterium]